MVQYGKWLSAGDSPALDEQITPTLNVNRRRETVISNESVPIQLTRCCRFPGLAISNAKISMDFSNKICRSNFFYQTALGNCYDLKLENR